MLRRARPVLRGRMAVGQLTDDAVAVLRPLLQLPQPHASQVSSNGGLQRNTLECKVQGCNWHLLQVSNRCITLWALELCSGYSVA